MTSITKVHENLQLENLPDEIWKDIPEYEGLYHASNLGRVKSLERKTWRNTHYLPVKERIIKQSIGNRGYLVVRFYRQGLSIQRQSHQVIAMTFKNHTPNGFKLVVDHKDNNPLNNHVDNLQIVTNRYNSSKDKKGYTSKYLGVSWHSKNKKWRSAIYHNGKETHLGYFTNQKEASKYYQDALKSIKEGTEIKVKRKTNTSKHKGIYKKGNKWALQIDGKYIGTFDSEEDAYIEKIHITNANN